MRMHKFLILLAGLFSIVQCSLDFSMPTTIFLPQSTDKAQLKSIQTQIPQAATITAKVDFNKTTFSQNQQLIYLGAKSATTDTNLTKYALSRVNPASPLPIVSGIAPDAGGLNGKEISNLAMFNSYLAATSDDKLIHLIVNPDGSGDKPLVSATLNDSNPTPAETNEIKAMATSNDYIFAAVSASGVSWDDNTDAGIWRGVSMVAPDYKGGKLNVLDANDIAGVTSNRASQINVKADFELAKIVVAFYKDGASSPISKAIFKPASAGKPSVDMFWDGKLQRLFVGMTDVSRDSDSRSGGVVSVVVGRIENDVTTGKIILKFVPIFADPANKFTANDENQVVGFYFQSSVLSKRMMVSAKRIRIMHASTGKDYLILHSAVVTNSTPYQGIFALPLISSDETNPQNIGTVSDVPVTVNVKQKFADKFTVGESKELASSLSTETLSDLFVHGDSVYMCLSGSKDRPNDKGIFQSTAIFNASGDVIGWSTWQRVMGAVDRVFAGGLSNQAGDFYYLTGATQGLTDNTSNTVKITQWGTTEYASVNPDGSANTTHNLSTVLAEIFPQQSGGIFQMIDFNNQIDGIGANNSLSMMAVLGYDKVALVQTGKVKQADLLDPTITFNSGENVIVFSSPALTAIAPLCHAEVSRTNEKDKGYLFVCGLGGVAVLVKDNIGAGWDAKTGLDTVKDLAGYSFVQLKTKSTNSFASARKVICSDNLLYVLTKDNLYKIDFTKPFISMPIEEVINLQFPATVKFADFLLIQGANNARTLILGTTTGLFSSSTTDFSSVGFSKASQVGLNSDPAIHLNYISEAKKNASQEGNLYVLFSSFVDETGKVYRYYVNGSSILPISATTGSSGLFVDLNYFRGNFVTDGSFGYSVLGRGIGQNDLFHVYEMTTDAANKNYNLTWDIGINTELNWYIGTVTRNSASGSIYVPGDWGLIVNE